MRRATFIRRFTLGFILGSLIFAGIALGYRAPKPTQFTLPWDDNKVSELNNALENLWNITNGRYVPETTSSIPTASADEGDIKIYSSGGTYQIYIYLNDGWRVWSSD